MPRIRTVLLVTTINYRIKTQIGFWYVHTTLDNGIEHPKNIRFLQLECICRHYRTDTLELSEVRWWDSEEHSSASCDTAISFSVTPGGSKDESSVELILMVNAIRAFVPWKAVSNRILTPRFRSKIRCVSIIQCYASTKTFYEKFNTVQEMLPQNEFVIIGLGDLNAKVMRKHCLGDRYDTVVPVDCGIMEADKRT